MTRRTRNVRRSWSDPTEVWVTVRGALTVLAVCALGFGATFGLLAALAAITEPVAGFYVGGWQ